MSSSSLVSGLAADASAVDAELRLLFHKLTNPLGIILAHAEILESRAVDGASRARATQVVTGTLDAMGTARQVRLHAESMSL